MADDWGNGDTTTATGFGSGRGFGRGMANGVDGAKKTFGFRGRGGLPTADDQSSGGNKPGGFGGRASNQDDSWGGSSSQSSSGFGGRPAANGDGDAKPRRGGFGGGFGGRPQTNGDDSGGDSKPSRGGFGGRGSSRGGGGGFGSRGGDGEAAPRGGGFGGRGGSSGSGCFKCGEEGHMSRECPQGGSGGGGSRACFKCGEEGHMSRECPSGGGGGGGSRACFKCGEEGHMSRECPKGGGGGGGSRACFKCGEEGHMSRECPSGGGGGGGGSRACYKCGEEGHMSRECPSGGGGGGGGGGKGCFKCGEDGHFSKECPNQDSSGKEDRPPPYIPPALTENEDEIFDSYEKGINFDKYDNISVEVSGRDPVGFINSFDEAGLYPTFLKNVRKAKYEKPTPVQKYSIPIIAAGRDLMACAQTGSGKTAAFLLPTLTCMVKEGLTTSQFSEVQEPQAIIVAPTRELVIQIHSDARKFSWGSEVRPVVVYGGTSVGHQLREVERGAHIVVGTPGRLLDFIEKGKIGLTKVKFLILDEADRMLDMGFEPCIRKLVEQLGMPPKDKRQTLMFSATFPTDIQKLAADFLHDYLFLTVGRVGGANTDVEQSFFEVDRLQKRDKLCSILTELSGAKTLVFVEQKRNADFLASYLSQSGFPTTSIHGDRLQREREEALQDFKRGKAPILVATSVAARGLDIPRVEHVVNYDLPSSIDEYVHRIGRTGRCGNLGKAVSFYSHDSDSQIVKSLVRILTEAHQIVPEWLSDYAMTSDGVIDHSALSGQYGGKDIRRGKFSGSGGEKTGKAWEDSWGGGGGGGGGAVAAAADEEEWD